MAVYSYRACDSRQQSLGGTIAADSPRQARELLRERGLLVQQLSEVFTPGRATGPRRLGWRWPQRVSRQALVTLTRDLSTLLSAGIPLVEALETSISQSRGRLRTVLMQIRERVAEGASLASAAGDHPGEFDALSIQMIDVGENAGNLDEVLSQLADFKEQSLQWKDRVTGALLYPAIVLLAALGVTLFLMTAVVPTLLDNLIEAGKPLPFPTRVVKGFSDALVQYGIWAAGALGIVALLIGAFIASPDGRRVWHRLLLRTPLLGELVRKQAVSRLSLIISVLLRSGIEFLQACEIASRSMGNVVLRNALDKAAENVRQGQDIGPALSATGIFSPVVIQVFAVGQQTGQLEPMLARLSHDYDRQIATLSHRFATLLEPVLIVLLSTVVGFILFATILPILEAGNVL